MIYTKNITFIINAGYYPITNAPFVYMSKWPNDQMTEWPNDVHPVYKTKSPKKLDDFERIVSIHQKKNHADFLWWILSWVIENFPLELMNGFIDLS